MTVDGLSGTGIIQTKEGRKITVVMGRNRIFRDQKYVHAVSIRSEAFTSDPGVIGKLDIKPTDHPPGLKKPRHLIEDDEIEDEEKNVMPDKARERKRYKEKNIGHSGAIQTY